MSTKRYTAEVNKFSADPTRWVWWVLDNTTQVRILLPGTITTRYHAGEGEAGRQRAVAIANALNALEG